MYNSDFFFKGVNVGGGGELRSGRGGKGGLRLNWVNPAD